MKIELDDYIMAHISPEEFKKVTGVIIAKHIYILGFPIDVKKFEKILENV